MKRIIFVLFFVYVLYACSAPAPWAQPSAPPSDSPEAVTPSAVPLPLPSPTLTAAGLEADLDAFFGMSPNLALERLQPMLESVAYSACIYWEPFTGKPSDKFAWNSVYLLVNNYPSEFGEFVTQLEDGALVMKSESVRMAFKTCFAYPYDVLPPIGKDHESILSYDAEKDVYRFVRSENEMDAYRIENVTLSPDGNSAIADVVVLLGDSADDTPYEEVGRAAVELVADSSAKYGFNVKSVTVSPPQI